eukprot:CAMPEP_0181533562 /NCGR_PEP_ID=MMETSP1110-20121109/73218_1 /TAXON_ID=174948 /ORGANISM="Symbiodinium sp., Strain CCMP421" /LENGTH=79 /DNA_ID=CAMNT_0023664743 /DNA_START=95 /DNA_END=331 /DNA_ORIENTATION=-
MPSTTFLQTSTSAREPMMVTFAFSSVGVCCSTKQWAFEYVFRALMVDAFLPMSVPTALCGISSTSVSLLAAVAAAAAAA